MHLDQRAMCPKHGIAHGVCVNPIPVHAATDEIIRIDENGVVHCAENDHGPLDEDKEECSVPSRCVIHNPNRFDPYEALDEIRELSPLAGVRRNVERLRAYITGMRE